ncbi:MAG: PHP domain-containing protein [Clostridia bacterium]|nr:PHP domain-containing protein [Clostridia bacterium]
MAVYEYIGNLHVHSSYSDGSGTIPEIAQAGNEAGVDFVIINDHFTLKALQNGEEGYYDRVLVLIGTEINRRWHHYLVMGLNREVAGNDSNPQEVINEVNWNGGFGIIAHPFEVGSPVFFGGKAYTWNDWSVVGYSGIEIWNYCSQWRDGADNLLSTLYSGLINPNWRITGPCSKALAKVDSIGQKRKIVIIGGTDAHAVKVNMKLTTLTIFPYDFLFRTVNTHILVPEPLTNSLAYDKQLIYHALKEGSGFVAFDYFAPAKGFRFLVEHDLGEVVIGMGAETAFEPGMVAKVFLPEKAIIKLFHNGNCLHESVDSQLCIPLSDSGVYRVEAFLRRGIFNNKLIPWIFSNPIFLR